MNVISYTIYKMARHQCNIILASIFKPVYDGFYRNAHQLHLFQNAHNRCDGSAGALSFYVWVAYKNSSPRGYTRIQYNMRFERFIHLAARISCIYSNVLVVRVWWESRCAYITRRAYLNVRSDDFMRLSGCEGFARI